MSGDAKVRDEAPDLEYKALELFNVGQVQETLSSVVPRGWHLAAYQVSGEGLTTRHYLVLQRHTAQFLEQINYQIGELRRGNWDFDPNAKAKLERVIERATGEKVDYSKDFDYTYIP